MEKKVNGHLVVDITGMSDNDIREEVAKIIREHPRKGAINILEAKPNLELASYVRNATSFLNECGFEFNFATRCYAFANGMTSIEEMPHCQKCGKLLTWNVCSVHRGFEYKHCSSKCSANDESTVAMRKKTNEKRHGDPNWNNIERMRKTCLERYGSECSLQNEEVKAKSRARKTELYGNPFYVNSEQSVRTKFKLYGMGADGKAISEGKRRKAEADPEYYEKQLAKKRATNAARGLDPDWNNLEKAEATKLERYGDAHWNNREKGAKTKLERYGDERWNNHEKAETTCMERYGVGNYAKSEWFAAKSVATCMEKYGAANFSQSEAGRAKLSVARNTMMFERFGLDSNRTKPLFGLDEYLEKTSRGTFRWKCAECGREFEAPVNFIFARETGNFARCLECHPVTFCNSNKQREMFEFVADLVGEKAARENDRRAIRPKEIDVFVPGMKLGFEFDGMFWHSTYWNSDMTHLSEKTGTCSDRGIILCHVFEDEWDLRRKAVEDRIEGMLLGNGKKCGKDLSVSDADLEEAEAFYRENSTDLFVKESDFSLCLRDGKGSARSMISFNANAGKVTVNAFQNAIGTRLGDSFKVLTDAISERFAGKAGSISVKVDARWPDVSIFDGTGFEFVKFSGPQAWLVDADRWRRVRSNVTKASMSEFFGREFDGRPLVDQLHELKHALIFDCGKILFRAKI